MAALTMLVGGRVLDIVQEVARCLEVNGCAKVNWKNYMTRTKMKDSNLYPLLRGLEDNGILRRELDHDGQLLGWNSLWVNPLVLRHPWAKEAYVANQVASFYRKRGEVLAARGTEDPVGGMAEKILSLNWSPEQIARSHKRKYTLRKV